MRLLFTIGLFLIMVNQSVLAGAAALNDVESLTWKNRIIIVFSDQTEQYETVIEQLQFYQNEVDDRDIVWFVLTGEALLSNAGQKLSDQLDESLQKYDNRSQNAGFSAVLIGKDGGVKDRQTQWDIDKLFALIDTMPMRQREMRKEQ